MDHKNPTGTWSHMGSYSIILTDDAERGSLPSGVTIEGNSVSVSQGRVAQSMGGIDFYVGDQAFGFWPYSQFKQILDGSGKLIWQNKNYQ